MSNNHQYIPKPFLNQKVCFLVCFSQMKFAPFLLCKLIQKWNDVEVVEWVLGGTCCYGVFFFPFIFFRRKQWKMDKAVVLSASCSMCAFNFEVSGISQQVFIALDLTVSCVIICCCLNEGNGNWDIAAHHRAISPALYTAGIMQATSCLQIPTVFWLSLQ